MTKADSRRLKLERDKHPDVLW